MELAKLYKRVVGLDVHQAKITACAITEDEAGQTSVELAEFGGFKRDRQAMAQWVAAHGAEMVVMESTGIYWKSPHAALEQVGIVATVVNARHVKTVPGRKTFVTTTMATCQPPSSTSTSMTRCTVCRSWAVKAPASRPPWSLPSNRRSRRRPPTRACASLYNSCARLLPTRSSTAQRSTTSIAH